MRQQDIHRGLREILGQERIATGKTAELTYSYDASLDRCCPDAVVYPLTTSEVMAVVGFLHSHGIPFVARGAGTNLSGGSLTLQRGVVIAMNRMDRILEIDVHNHVAVVEPGVINLDLQQALKPHGFFFAPDPASQKVSTIGGNAAENAGGPHCVKYGVTSNHILGLQVVLPDGSLVEVGGKTHDQAGPDLLGLLTGSEGTLGIVTRITVKLLPLPEQVKTILAIFDDLGQASHAVSAIIARGIIPATLEMMDRTVIRAVQSSMDAGLPVDCAAVLIIELEGIREAVEEEAESIQEVLADYKVREVRVAKDDSERDRLWQGRRGAFAALTRIAPNCFINDGTVPRTRLPEVLARVMELAKQEGLTIGNVFHAGDGNLHPIILFDAQQPGMKDKVMDAGRKILKICVDAGGTISGEHGIGIEKKQAMKLLFSAREMDFQKKIKTAFDPKGLCNPGKIFPD